MKDDSTPTKTHAPKLTRLTRRGLLASGAAAGVVAIAAPAIVKAATDWPQFNFIIYHSCIRPSFWVLQSLQDIENLPGSMSPTVLVDTDGHAVPNIRWSTQFAQIAGGKYVASIGLGSLREQLQHVAAV